MAQAKETNQAVNQPGSGWTGWAISTVSSKIAGAVIDLNDIQPEDNLPAPKTTATESQRSTSLPLQSKNNPKLSEKHRATTSSAARKPLVLSAKPSTDWGNEGWGDDLVYFKF